MNAVVYPSILWFIAFHLSRLIPTPLGLERNDPLAALPLAGSIQQCAYGIAACLGVMMLIYLTTNTGAGDVKLCTLVGAAMGPERGLAAVLWCIVLAGLATLGFILYRLGLVSTIRLAWRSTVARVVFGLALPLDEHSSSVMRAQVPLAIFLLPAVVLVALEEIL